MNPINITEKLQQIHQHWSPKVVGRLNGQEVKLAKIKGDFVWHHHEKEDELFLVIKGEFAMEYRDRTEIIREGDFVIVPRGVEHRPVAKNEAHILLFEPANTLNTGNIQGDLTVENPEII
jgi:mannose-6-phosphate isomerase-like protein (cupin superfamily)